MKKRNHRRPAVAAVLASGVLLGLPASAEVSSTICLAPSSASLIGIQGADAGSAIDELLASYLAGPTFDIVRLQSRVPTLARNEAAGLACDYMLFTTVKHQRRNSGFTDRLVAGAIHSGASNAAVLADSTGGRVLAGAAAGAAGTVVMSTDVRTRDEISLAYRLERAGGKTVTSKTTKRRASADGEDVLTPMIEDVVEAVAVAASSR
jgi:hypothetical protein